MELARLLPLLLGLAWLLPLASFALIVFLGPRLGRAGRYSGYVATAAIMAGFVLSMVALLAWIGVHPTGAHEVHAAHNEVQAAGISDDAHAADAVLSDGSPHSSTHRAEGDGASHDHHATSTHGPVAVVSGEWYTLCEFGALRLTIGYYIDALTIAMFVMVTLVASCIHVYSFGYMHEELHDVTDPLAPLSDGQPLRRRGRFHRFYQYLSLFCFSMLGLVVAGNIAMVFVFWELVGICSYLLIGFYIERRSASLAANKAFIVNRVGDFGMLIGLMVIWSALGTFSFGDVAGTDGQKAQQGIFTQVRPADREHGLVVPEGMVMLAARDQVAEIAMQQPDPAAARAEIATKVPQWREAGFGYGLLVLAGLGIFCGCVGKSAQFPLHVWLPDAMEGPTPVSALIHAATMVAAGVYLVGRFYPVFAPEVLLVIAYTGCITLFIAATIAITATDIKRVLAYSTVSQLGYMMLALGVGGWIAGLFHLLTHAFFKALLFMCSGSVIHACGTNEMPEMGGLRKKMPWTAYTMLVGALAISGAGVPLVAGLSGFYSKDSILAQVYSFKAFNPVHAWLFYAAAGGAAITAFYMFRLWYMTFAGTPRIKSIYDHAHESPRTMTGPLVVLAALAIVSGWSMPLTGFNLTRLLAQATPAGTAETAHGGFYWPGTSMPAEHLSHADEVHIPVSLIAFTTALAGFILATAFYGTRSLDPNEVRRQFYPLYWFFRHKWWFDELYQTVFVRPSLWLAGRVADFDRRGIDWVADGLARVTAWVSGLDDWVDRRIVDGAIDRFAESTYRLGLRLRAVQTGQVRQYVVYIVVGTVALFVLISLYWNFAVAGTGM